MHIHTYTHREGGGGGLGGVRGVSDSTHHQEAALGPRGVGVPQGGVAGREHKTTPAINSNLDSLDTPTNTTTNTVTTLTTATFTTTGYNNHPQVLDTFKEEYVTLDQMLVECKEKLRHFERQLLYVYLLYVAIVCVSVGSIVVYCVYMWPWLFTPEVELFDVNEDEY